MKRDDDFLTLDEAAARYRVPTAAAFRDRCRRINQRLAQQRRLNERIAFYKLGRAVLVKASEIEAAMKRRFA